MQIGQLWFSVAAAACVWTRWAEIWEMTVVVEGYVLRLISWENDDVV